MARIVGRSRCRWALATAVVFASAVASPVTASGASTPFCDTATVHNYAKPLVGMPRTHRVPIDQQLPFGPKRVFIGRMGPGPLLVGRNETGFFLSFSPNEAEAPFSPTLNWIVEAHVARVDHRGQARERLGMTRRTVKRLWSDESHPSRQLDLSFEISQPGLYLVEMTIGNQGDKLLARYGEYVRVLAHRPDVRLTLNKDSFAPGESVIPRLKNYGTDFLRYGLLGASYERLDGSAWVPASFGNGFKLAIGLGMGPGLSAACWDTQIPADTPPGQYRFRLRVEPSRSPHGRAGEIFPTAEFSILPAA